MNPYVLTLALEAAAQERFDRERAALFPAGRTQVGAHVTLFHAVPGEVPVEEALGEAADRPAFEVVVSEVMSLGRGAAYRLESTELAAVHAVLRGAWAAHLTRQDAQPFRPHVTVHNKVDPAEAEATVARLRRAFEPWSVAVVGLELWRYDGGPWTPLRRFPFATNDLLATHDHRRRANEVGDHR